MAEDGNNGEGTPVERQLHLVYSSDPTLDDFQLPPENDVDAVSAFQTPGLHVISDDEAAHLYGELSESDLAVLEQYRLNVREHIARINQEEGLHRRTMVGYKYQIAAMQFDIAALWGVMPVMLTTTAGLMDAMFAPSEGFLEVDGSIGLTFGAGASVCYAIGRYLHGKARRQ